MKIFFKSYVPISITTVTSIIMSTKTIVNNNVEVTIQYNPTYNK